jgi:hypothetical protein
MGKSLLKAFAVCEELGYAVATSEDSSRLNLDPGLSRVITRTIWVRQKDRKMVVEGGSRRTHQRAASWLFLRVMSDCGEFLPLEIGTENG